jgi:hypothetical protein
MPTPNALPQLSITIDLPEMLDPKHKDARINRVHDAAVKDAGRRTLVLHQTKRLPGHFDVPARAKYRHYARSPRVAAQKRVRGQPDLVRSGSTRVQMTQRRPHALRAGGRAESGKVKFTMVLRFPSHFRERASAERGVTRAKMADEIARWIQPEETEAAQTFRNLYVDLIKTRLSARVKKRIAGRLGELGIT